MTDRALLGVIENLAQLKRGCIASNETLGRALGVSPKSVANRLTVLRRLGYIAGPTESDRKSPHGREKLIPTLPGNGVGPFPETGGDPSRKPGTYTIAIQEQYDDDEEKGKGTLKNPSLNSLPWGVPEPKAKEHGQDGVDDGATVVPPIANDLHQWCMDRAAEMGLSANESAAIVKEYLLQLKARDVKNPKAYFLKFARSDRRPRHKGKPVVDAPRPTNFSKPANNSWADWTKLLVWWAGNPKKEPENFKKWFGRDPEGLKSIALAHDENPSAFEEAFRADYERARATA